MSTERNSSSVHVSQNGRQHFYHRGLHGHSHCGHSDLFGCYLRLSLLRVLLLCQGLGIVTWHSSSGDIWSPSTTSSWLCFSRCCRSRWAVSTRWVLIGSVAFGPKFLDIALANTNVYANAGPIPVGGVGASLPYQLYPGNQISASMQGYNAPYPYQPPMGQPTPIAPCIPVASSGRKA